MPPAPMVAMSIEDQVHALLSMVAWRHVVTQLHPLQQQDVANAQPPPPSPQAVVGHVLHAGPTAEDHGALDDLQRWWRSKANAAEFTTEGGIRDLMGLLVRNLTVAVVDVDADHAAGHRGEPDHQMLVTLDISHEIGTTSALQQNSAVLLRLVSEASMSLRTFNASVMRSGPSAPTAAATDHSAMLQQTRRPAASSLATHVRSAWPTMHALTTLQLNGQRLGCAGVQDLAASLPKFPALKQLELQDVGCGPKGGAALGSGLGVVAATLEVLDLSENRIGCGAVYKVLTALAAGGRQADGNGHSARLEALGLRQTGLGPNTCPSVGAALARFAGSLRRLDLSSNALGVSGASSLAPHLAELRSLRRLNARDNLLGDAGIVALCPTLQVLLQTGRLASLSLSNNRVQALGAGALAKVLASCGGGGLADVSLSGNRLTSLGWRSLGSSIAKLDALHALDVSGTGLLLAGPNGTGSATHDDTSARHDHSGIASFAGGLRLVPHSMRRLVLDGNVLDVQAMHLVATAVRRMLCLEALSLCNCQLGNDALGYLADHGLVESTGLRSLLLRGNAFGAPGMHRLAQQLPALANLGTLDVSDTPLGGLGAAQLGAYIDTATTLHTLTVAGTRLGDGGAAALAVGIAGLPALRCLQLDHAVVGVQGVEALTSQIAANVLFARRLQVLTLCGNALGDAGMLRLCQGGVLDAMAALETLDVGHTLFETTGALALAAALSRLGSDASASRSIDGAHPLRWLSLSGNVLTAPGDQATVSILRALKPFTRVASLDMIIGNGMPIAHATRAACLAFAETRTAVLASFVHAGSTATAG